MHRGTYSKIPVIMGEYDTDLASSIEENSNKLKAGQEKHPRSWYANNDGRLYFVTVDGKEVIDVWDCIIKDHEKDGHHEQLELEEPIEIGLTQNGNNIIGNNVYKRDENGNIIYEDYKDENEVVTKRPKIEREGVLQIYKTGNQGYKLNIDKALSLGLKGTGPIINDKNGNPTVVEETLPINYGGIGGNGAEIPDSYFIVRSGNKLIGSGFNGDMFATKTELKALEVKINNLIDGLGSSYITKSNFNNFHADVAEFVKRLPTMIYDMIFPTTDTFNDADGVRILQMYPYTPDKKGQHVRIVLNKNTGWGLSEHGGDGDNHKQLFNKKSIYFTINGSRSESIGNATVGKNDHWDNLTGDDINKTATKISDHIKDIYKSEIDKYK